MLFMIIYIYRRFSAVRSAAGLFAATVAILMVVEFSLLATPVVSAKASAAPHVVLEGRYSGEPQLMLQRPVLLDTSAFAQP